MKEPDRSLLAELEHRIHTMEQHAEDSFGRFSRRDWLLCLMLGVAIPALLLWVIHP
jgi:hypothetical protein